MENNFSNSEIGSLMKLRQQRDPSYVAAFLQYALNFKLSQMVK